MEDYSNLKGGISATPPSERVWGVEKKSKTADRNSRNGRRQGGDRSGRDRAPATAEGEQPPEERVLSSGGEESFGYGSYRVRKKGLRQVDLII